jgi:hypothetical protein
MLLLKAKVLPAEITVVEIGDKQQIIFQLFADDTGLFFHASEEKFWAIMDCLSVYKRISWATINLDKSTLIQLDTGAEPEWYQRAGCSIALPGQVLKYLGCPMGKNVTSTQEINFVLDKLRAQLRHWTHRFLSMASKLIALKHILRAMPVFHLLILDFTQEGYNRLESICRTFLWGTAESGNPKIPLITWPKIVQSKLTGGLGLKYLFLLTLCTSQNLIH